MSKPNIDLKTLLQDFLDCKDETSIIAEKALKSNSEEAIKHVIGEQSRCLKIIHQIKNEPSLEKYKEGLLASEARILSEQKFLLNITNSNFETLTSSTFGIGLLAQREKALWEEITTNAFKEEAPYWTFQWVEGSMMLGWAIFIIIAGLLTFKGKLGINSESIKLYFENQRQKFFNFLLKILDSDKK